MRRQRGSRRTAKIESLNERESERGAGSGRYNTAKGIRFTSRLVNTPRIQRTSASLREKNARHVEISLGSIKVLGYPRQASGAVATSNLAMRNSLDT